MADFTGLTVQVTLKEPPNFVVVGKVRQVVPGQQTLTLQDGEEYTIVSALEACEPTLTHSSVLSTQWLAFSIVDGAWTSDSNPSNSQYGHRADSYHSNSNDCSTTSHTNQ